MIADPKPGKRVEISVGLEWFPAVITRGPFVEQGQNYWEVEATDNLGETYMTARTVEGMREP